MWDIEATIAHGFPISPPSVGGRGLFSAHKNAAENTRKQGLEKNFFSPMEPWIAGIGRFSLFFFREYITRPVDTDDITGKNSVSRVEWLTPKTSFLEKAKCKRPI